MILSLLASWSRFSYRDQALLTVDLPGLRAPTPNKSYKSSRSFAVAALHELTTASRTTIQLFEITPRTYRTHHCVSSHRLILIRPPFHEICDELALFGALSTSCQSQRQSTSREVAPTQSTAASKRMLQTCPHQSSMGRRIFAEALERRRVANLPNRSHTVRD